LATKLKTKFRDGFLRKHRLSVFLKLFLVWLSTGLAVFAVIAFTMRQQVNDRARLALNRNLENYFTFLAQEIGTPPDTVKAKAIAEKYALQIYFENEDMQWISHPEKSSPHRAIRRIARRHAIPRWVEDQQNVIQNADGSRFVFKIDHAFFFEHRRERIIIFFGILALIFIVNYLLIREILNPIKLLKSGVHEVSEGNLMHRIPKMQNDELGDLSASFNIMTQRIREMLRSREQLLLDVSHELRSPITRMKLALEFLPEDNNKRKIQDDIAEMETMITEILESERIKNGHGGLDLHTHDLVKIIREVAANFESRKPGINLDALPEACKLNLDVERIRIVLKNILDNAFKYSLIDSQPIRIVLIEKDDIVRVEIKDDGSGIPEEHLPYLFEPFYRVDKSRSKKTGGYGLGLSLCKKIMEAHGGKIEIGNNADRGLTVKLYSKKRMK
jgi:signal transduction histidine kinase